MLLAQNLTIWRLKKRRETLALVELVLELGLPNQAASKVFLAGI